MNKKSLLIIVAVLLTCLIFTACAKDEAMGNIASEPQMMSADRATTAEEAGDMYYGDDEEYETKATNSDGEDKNYSEKIIYNVNMGIVVDNPVEVSKQIKNKVNEMGGYISSSYSNKNDDNANYVNMQIRVPSKGLNGITDYISSISEVEYENMSTDNITDSYYDTIARLDHEKLQAKQLEEIMEKATNIKDILTVREELSRVQETIEVYEGRIRMWNSLVDYSTIDISISPTPTIDNNNGLIRVITLGETGRGIVRAFNNSWRVVANFFSLLARIIAALFIPAVIIVPIIIVIVRISKKKDTNKNDN